ncbi:tetratricopeptide repeat protein [Streptomyces sp. CC208A]|uniref:tetratricopeptide repeat protein n=1 Tax=Streptomyces sp. CC208A TaxID=3044573 RepID=UPI0024A7F452|nr:tetratricopeptide repeat protein [Streptomyces sp. CC208A]
MTRVGVPARPSDFIGQDHLLEEEIPHRLRSVDGRQALVLQGVRGSGATTVALEYLHRTHPRHYAAAAWIAPGRRDEVRREIRLALDRFREIGGPALIVLDGVPHPEWLSGLLRPSGPHVLVTTSEDATVWAEVEHVRNVEALTSREAVHLLRRFAPGLAAPVAEELAERLDHWPEALSHIGQQLSRTLSADQVLDMSRQEFCELLRRGGTPNPVGRVENAIAALSGQWPLAQDLLRALALIGAPAFPTRRLGPVVHRPHSLTGRDSLSITLVIDALVALSRRGLVRYEDNGVVVPLNLPRLVALLTMDASARTRAERLAEGLIVAFSREDDALSPGPSEDRTTEHILALAPHRVITPEGRSAMVKLVGVHLAACRYEDAIEQLSRFRAVWGDQGGEPWQAQIDRLLACAFEGTGDLYRALDHAERARAQETKRHQGPNRIALTDAFEVSRITGMKDPRAALLLAEGLSDQQAALLGENDRDTLRTHGFVADLLLRTQRPQAAAEQARAVWHAQHLALGEEDRETLATLHLLGMALEATGHSAREALRCYREARRLRSRALGRDHRDTKVSADACRRVQNSLKPRAV